MKILKIILIRIFWKYTKPKKYKMFKKLYSNFDLENSYKTIKNIKL